MVASCFLIFPHLLEYFHFWKSVFLLWKKPLLPSLMLPSGRNRVHSQLCPSVWGLEQLWVRWRPTSYAWIGSVYACSEAAPCNVPFHSQKSPAVDKKLYVILLDFNSFVSFYLLRFLHVPASLKTRRCNWRTCPPRYPLSPQSRGYN